MNNIFDVLISLNVLKKNEKGFSKVEVVKIKLGVKNGIYGIKMKLILW